MARRFADLHLRCPAQGADHLQQLLESVRAMDYGQIAIEFGSQLLDLTGIAKEICNKLGLEVLTRLDLDVSNAESLTRMLRHNRGRFDIVAAMCRNRHISRQAASDPRVDLLEFPRDPRERRVANFGYKEAQLVADRPCVLEFDFSALLRAEQLGQAQLLSIMRTELAIALEENVQIVATSGAEDLYGLIAPRDLASLLSLLGADWHMCLEAVSTNLLQADARDKSLESPLRQDADTR